MNEIKKHLALGKLSNSYFAKIVDNGAEYVILNTYVFTYSDFLILLVIYSEFMTNKRSWQTGASVYSEHLHVFLQKQISFHKQFGVTLERSMNGIRDFYTEWFHIFDDILGINDPKYHRQQPYTKFGRAVLSRLEAKPINF